MLSKDRYKVAIIIIACLCISSCERPPRSDEESKPATVESIGGTNFNRVTLTAEAAKRIDLQTVPVNETIIDGTLRKVIPYSAVLYGIHGETWAYTSPKSLSFIRVPITIFSINGNLVALSEGPPKDTLVVSVGAAELYGTEYQGSIEP